MGDCGKVLHQQACCTLQGGVFDQVLGLLPARVLGPHLCWRFPTSWKSDLNTAWRDDGEWWACPGLDKLHNRAGHVIPSTFHSLVAYAHFKADTLRRIGLDSVYYSRPILGRTCSEQVVFKLNCRRFFPKGIKGAIFPRHYRPACLLRFRKRIWNTACPPLHQRHVFPNR